MNSSPPSAVDICHDTNVYYLPQPPPLDDTPPWKLPDIGTPISCRDCYRLQGIPPPSPTRRDPGLCRDISGVHSIPTPVILFQMPIRSRWGLLVGVAQVYSSPLPPVPLTRVRVVELGGVAEVDPARPEWGSMEFLG